MESNTIQIDRRWWGAVIAGPIGTGKTAVGDAVYRRTNFRFLDADEFHTPEGRELIHSGVGVDDIYRNLWLHRVIGGMIACRILSRNIVIACSVLRRNHRLRLLEHAKVNMGTRLKIVWLDIPREEIERRVQQRDSRGGHFATSKLIESQFAAMEYPTTDEQDVIVVNGVGSPHLSEEQQINEVADRVLQSVRPWLFSD